MENTFRLQKCLRNPARDEVECLLINPQNVYLVIEQLENKYGRPELLIRSQLHKVREILPIQESHLDNLIGFATKVRNFSKKCKWNTALK